MSFAIAAAISSPQLLPSGVARSVLKSPATCSAAQRGCWLMVAMTRLMVLAQSEAMYHPTINHCSPPEANWKLSTFVLFCCIALNLN